jgi:hypothetical protein
MSEESKTKLIDTRDKGIKDGDDQGFMGAEDRTIKFPVSQTRSGSNRRGRQGTKNDARRGTKGQNMVEYRRKLYLAFETAQSNYMDRKREACGGMQKVEPLIQEITSVNPEE